MIHQIKPSQEKRDEEYPIPVTHFTAHSLFQTPHLDFCEFCLTEHKPLPSQGTMMPSSYGVTLLSLILLLFLATEVTTTEPSSTHANGSDKVDEPPFVPLVEASKLKTLVMNETRRRLGSFQICALCTCCGGAKGLCLPSPCCYAINCNIPNRPFGFCSFTPKTCNCFGCHY